MFKIEIGYISPLKKYINKACKLIGNSEIKMLVSSGAFRSIP